MDTCSCCGIGSQKPSSVIHLYKNNPKKSTGKGRLKSVKLFARAKKLKEYKNSVILPITLTSKKNMYNIFDRFTTETIVIQF